MKRYKDTTTGEEFDPGELDVLIIHDQTGFYIGLEEPGGAPFCRLSAYYGTAKTARKELKRGWKVRDEGIEDLVKYLQVAGKIVKRKPETKYLISGIRLRRDQVLRLADAGCVVTSHRKNNKPVFNEEGDPIMDVKLPTKSMVVQEPNGSYGVAHLRRCTNIGGPVDSADPLIKKLKWAAAKDGKYGTMMSLTLLRDHADLNNFADA